MIERGWLVVALWRSLVLRGSFVRGGSPIREVEVRREGIFPTTRRVNLEFSKREAEI